MRKGFLIYEERRKYFPMYEEDISVLKYLFFNKPKTPSADVMSMK
jgi:hypothetical protein